MNKNSKYLNNDTFDVNLKSTFLSSSPSDNTLRIYPMDDKKLNIDEPDNLHCTEKRVINCKNSKVRNVTESKENCSKVAILVSENGIIEVISDMETMV